MKKINLITLLFLLACLFTVNGHKNFQASYIADKMAENDNPLVLKVDMLYDMHVVKMSFNGISEGLGGLTVFNSKGELIYQENGVDLAPEPYFVAIGVSALQAGECTFVLKTKTGEYKAVVKI